MQIIDGRRRPRRRLLGRFRLARIDTIAHPLGEPPQTTAVVFTGTPARGATLENGRGAAFIPGDWEVLGRAISYDVNHYPELLRERGGAPMPRRSAP